MTPRWYVSRRTLLRGAGTGVALPFLEAMVRPGLQAAAAPAPRRFVGIWALPTGTVAKPDPVQGCMVAPWTPDETGPNYTPNMKFLAPFFEKNLNSKLTILTGLSDRASGGHHFWGCGSFLGRSRVACGAVDHCVQAVDVRGPSADQVAAEYLGQFTAIPSLSLSSWPRTTPNQNTPYHTYISWRNKRVPARKDVNPRDVFNRLFIGGSAAKAGESQEAAERRILYRKSVLDWVMDDAKRLRNRVGRADQQKFDQYQDSIRDIETEIDLSGAPASCMAGTPPQDLATTAGFADDAQLEVRLKIMMDLMVKAFECDRTRVATLMYTNAYGSPYGYPHLGLKGYHHTMSHYNQVTSPEEEAEKKLYMDTWTIWVLKMYAYLMSEMDKRTDPDGSTLLDNSVMHIGGEDSDSALHSCMSMPVLIGGRGGKTASGNWAINSGRHVRYAKWVGRDGGMPNYPGPLNPGERSVRDLLWSMMNIVGVPNLTAWGDATAPLDLG